MRTRSMITSALLACALVAAQASAQSAEQVLQTAVDERRVVGAVLVAIHDGNPLPTVAVGQLNRESGKAMPADAIFRLASVSKLVTTTLAMRLVDAGKLDLDAPVTQYLPDFKPTLPDGKPATILVRHLLTHTSGLTYRFMGPANGPYAKASVSDGLDDSAVTLSENVRRIGTAPLLFPPGERFQYSISIDVLGEVIARASGLSLQDALKQHVCEPLKLKDLAFSTTDADRLATPYYNAPEGPKPMGERYEQGNGDGTGIVYVPGRATNAQAWPSGGAGMVSSAGDVATLLEAVRADEQFLSAEARKLMFTPHVDASAATQGPGWGFGYGGALFIDPTKQPNLSYGKGTMRWGGAYGHTWFIDPERKLVAVLLTDTTPEGMAGRLSNEFAPAIYRAIK